MLTFEKVLDVFKEYLSEDDMYEVVMTSHGYTVMEWERCYGDWEDAKVCKTPEDMKDILLEKYVGYLEYQAADENGNITGQDKAEIEVKRLAILEKFN